jgi:UDP-N-acetylglucosamine 4,6-dehydratase/5-epimerase
MTGVFEGKVLLITGGTGSFGNTVLRRFLDTGIAEIRIFSRDEKKQDDQRKRYANPKLKFYIGDVREPASIKAAMRGVDFIFHAAALKQVPSCEFHPMEAVRTNVLGTENVLDAAIDAGVQRVVCLSTDKAVYPINAMGMSKAIMEKIVVAKSRSLNSGETVICGTRYGNVMGSRGSVIPLFLRQLRAGKSVTVTDPKMTRFMMTLDDAVDLVLYAFEHGSNGDFFVQKSPACTIETLAHAIGDLIGLPSVPLEVIGTRHGEKQHEVLLSREEMLSSGDLGGYFRIPPDTRDLNYEKYVETGESGIARMIDYTSENTHRLDRAATRELLMKLKLVRAAINGIDMDSEE